MPGNKKNVIYQNLSTWIPWWLKWFFRTCLRCRRPGFNPWIGKIPCRKEFNPLQYSCLENSMDRGAWQATVHRVTKSRTQLKQLSMHTLLGMKLRKPDREAFKAKV